MAWTLTQTIARAWLAAMLGALFGNVAAAIWLYRAAITAFAHAFWMPTLVLLGAIGIFIFTAWALDNA